MSMSYSSRAVSANTWSHDKARSFPKGFWMGVAMAVAIWSALAFGTALSLSASPTMEPPQLTLSH